MKPLVACIIETRAVSNLVEIIRDHMAMLPENTDLFIGHGQNNRELLYKEFPNAFLFSLDIKDVMEYNHLLTLPPFWRNFLPYEKVLIFQSDSKILRKGIEEFLKMDVDYIGASWNWNKDYPGNGGLSLRNPKIMLEICERYPWNGSLNEDHWLCMHMHEFKIGALATIAQADTFSVEQKFILGSLGCHAPCSWVTPNECQEIYNQYKK